MKRIETLLIIHQPPKILLGFKNPDKKFGGKWNGFGGGLEQGESLEECAIRETYSETGLRVKDLKKQGILLFHFETGDEHEVHIFKSGSYEGELDKSRDFICYGFFHTQEELLAIYDDMMPADRYWLPFFVNEKLFKGNVYFAIKQGKLKVKSHNIKKVNDLN